MKVRTLNWKKFLNFDSLRFYLTKAQHMSYYKLKTNLETLPPSVVKNYILSEDLKHLVIYNPSFFVYPKLSLFHPTKGVVLSNECNEQMRIKYCALDQDVFIVQYQTANAYILHIRGIRSALYCHEIETDQEITCHTKTDFSVDNTNRVFGIFFGTTAGRIKFFNFQIQNQLVEIDLKDDSKDRRQKIRKILLFPEPEVRLMILVDDTGLVSFYAFDNVFDCNLTNSYLANREKQWLIDCFRISKGQGDSRLALVLKTDDYISLYTAEPIKFVEPTNNANQAFVRTVLGKFSPYVKCVLLKEDYKRGEFKVPQGDVLALVDEGAREFVDFRFYFLNTGEEQQCRYTPAEKIKNSIGALFIDTSGLLLLSHNLVHNNRRITFLEKKINVCIVLNRATNVLFDQIQLTEDDRFTRLEKEKYEIFEDKFELKPHSLGLIRDLGLYSTRNDGIEETDPHQIKLSFVEFLLKNQKYQILIDILTKKVWKEDEEVFLMMELERFEDALFRIFELEKGEILFDYQNVDFRELKRYKLFLENILKVYNAIIKRKEEEAIRNVRALNTLTYSRLENDILTLFDRHRRFSKVLKECEFVQILNFVAENDVVEIYNKYYDQISSKWKHNRTKYDKLFSKINPENVEKPYQFFIDLFTEGQIMYPTSIDEIFRWIRTNDTTPNKKFIICYMIKKDFAGLAHDFSLSQDEIRQGDVQISEDAISILNKNFFNKFNMTDKEINQISGLVRLDLLIENAEIVRDREGRNFIIKKNEKLLRVAKEACYYLSSSDLGSDSWKDFVLNVFHQYECFDELAVFIRSGNINWEDPKFARDHIRLLLKLKKVLQAYYFASAQIEANDSNQGITKSFRELFYYYISEVIKEGLTSHLFNINFKNYEKEILEDYFRDHSQNAKYYILYLLKLNQTTEAVDYFIQNFENPHIDKNTRRFLVWKVGELPELIRTGIFETHPQLQSISKDSRNDQEMSEEITTTNVIGTALRNQGTSRNSDRLLKFAANRMSFSSAKKDKSTIAVNEIRGAVIDKEENEKRLGLFFGSQDKREVKKGLDQWNEPQAIDADNLFKPTNDANNQIIVEEEEAKNNSLILQKMAGRLGTDNTNLRSSSVLKKAGQNEYSGEREQGMQISSTSSMKKKLSQLF